MKKKIMKRLHEILIEIVKADDADLDKIGAELVKNKKKLMGYKPKAPEKKSLF